VQTLSILAATCGFAGNARLYEQLARDERGWSGICRRRREFKARCCDRFRQKIMDWRWRRGTFRRGSVRDLYEFLRYGPQQLGIALET